MLKDLFLLVFICFYAVAAWMFSGFAVSAYKVWVIFRDKADFYSMWFHVAMAVMSALLVIGLAWFLR